jgi:hypothetical protein
MGGWLRAKRVKIEAFRVDKNTEEDDIKISRINGRIAGARMVEAFYSEGQGRGRESSESSGGFSRSTAENGREKGFSRR